MEILIGLALIVGFLIGGALASAYYQDKSAEKAKKDSKYKIGEYLCRSHSCNAKVSGYYEYCSRCFDRYVGGF